MSCILSEPACNTLADADRPTRWDRLSPSTHPTPAEIQDAAADYLQRARDKDTAEALRRGEQVHREIEIALGKPATLQEMLTKYREAAPFRWFESRGKLVFLPEGDHWEPGREPPKVWVPKVLADAWYFEQMPPDAAEALRCDGGDLKDTNPKTAIGDKKVPLALCSPIAAAHWALAQFIGMCKYQAWNWRAAGVRSSTYVSAIRRHLDAYVSGEELDPVDGTHHLGNIMACAAILLDAKAAGKLNDDRPPSVDCRETYEFVEEQMAAARERYKHIEQRPYTIENTVIQPSTKHDGATDAA